MLKERFAEPVTLSQRHDAVTATVKDGNGVWIAVRKRRAEY
jgi:hypothetical protein